MYTLTPEHVHQLSEQELSDQRRTVENARSRRYRTLYELLELNVVAKADRSLEISGTFGVRSARLDASSNDLRRSPRKTARSR